MLWEAAGAVGASPVLMSVLTDQGVPSKLLQAIYSTSIQFAGKCLGTRLLFPNSSYTLSSSKEPRLGFSTPTPYVDSMPHSKIKSCPVGPTSLYGSQRRVARAIAMASFLANAM